MPRSKQSGKSVRGEKQEHARRSPAVDDYLATLQHAHKDEIKAVRDVVMSADPSIHEGVKWNAPSFWRGEWFATFHLRAKGGVMLIIHRGAKVQSAESTRYVEDPEGVLQWLTNDRCAVVFENMITVQRKAEPLRAVIRRWVRRMDADAPKTQPGCQSQRPALVPRRRSLLGSRSGRD